MLHHILVKWTDEVADKPDLAAQVEALFQGVLSVDGVHDVSVHPNVINRPNRYDLLIRIDMDEAALPAYDECETTTAGRITMAIWWRRRPSLTAIDSPGLSIDAAVLFCEKGA